MTLGEGKDDALTVVIERNPTLPRDSVVDIPTASEQRDSSDEQSLEMASRYASRPRHNNSDGSFLWLTAMGFVFLTFNSGMAIHREQITQSVRWISIVDKTVGFLVLAWGGTVLLGGFASELNMKDFVFVSLVSLYLLIRVRCPSHVLQDSMAMLAFSVMYSCCVIALSVTQLISQHFGETEEAYMATRNLALNVFYAMSLTDSLLNLFFNALYYILGDLRRRSS